MKRLITLLAFISCLVLKGQTNKYHPFPDSNAVWNEEYWYQVGPPYTNVHNPNILFLSGDTVISSLQYKKILSSGYEYAYTTYDNCCF